MNEYDDILDDIILLCGNIASFDMSSGYSYRCNRCMATVGSIGMPRECAKLYEIEKVVDILKGKND